MNPPKMIVLDGYAMNPGDLCWDELQSLGEVEIFDRSPVEDLVMRSLGAEIIITNKAPLSAGTLAQLPDLKLIVVTATGYNIVDVKAARNQNIAVVNVPEYGTDSVAQHTIALLLHLCQHVAELDADVQAGKWISCADFCFWNHSPVELAGLTMGIIGFGRIGRKVGQIANALGMKILASSRSNQGHPGYEPFGWASPEKICEQADVITLHCPLTDENNQFIDAELLKRFKPGAMLINTARGQLINEAALVDALNNNQLAGAALDAISAEPMAENNPLLRTKNCIITPHMAWAALAARKRLMSIVIENY